MLLLLLLLFEPRPLDQCSFFACALLYPGPISTFHSRSVVHSLCRLSSAFGELVHVLYVVPSLALLCVYVSVCVLPLQFVNRRAATSDNPLFTIHNLNPVSHLSSICITILVCPFNKTSACSEMHIRARVENFTNSNFLPIRPARTSFFMCEACFPNTLHFFPSSFLRLVLVTDCLCDYIFIYFFVFAQTAF